jgi:hypothetical protein
MYMSRRLAVMATALGTVAAGLISGATISTADASTAPAGQTVEVFVKRNHTIAMPTEIRPGVTKFKISSARAAGFQILQAAPGYTKAEAMRDANAGLGKNRLKALKRFEANITLLGGMSSTAKKSATMSLDLDEGSYWAVDTMPQSIDPAKILTFEVAGDSVGGRLGGHVIRATGDAEWGKASPRIPTKGVIWFQNRSDANHFVEIVKLAEGKTMKDFRAWLKRAKQGDESNPPVNFKVRADTGVISGGESMTFKYRLPKGQYVMLCWWPDADMRGMPHAFMGMVRGLKVG